MSHGHGYAQIFEENGRKPEQPENRSDIGLGIFNRDKQIHTNTDRMKYFKKQTDQLKDKIKEMAEHKSKQEVIEYEGD